jgi:hypothetical protein
LLGVVEGDALALLAASLRSGLLSSQGGASCCKRVLIEAFGKGSLCHQ